MFNSFRQIESVTGKLTTYGRAIHPTSIAARVRGLVCDVLFGSDPSMPNGAEPTRQSSDERFHEIAMILATGVLRLHQRAALVRAEDEKNRPKSSLAGLELPAETRLSVGVG